MTINDSSDSPDTQRLRIEISNARVFPWSDWWRGTSHAGLRLVLSWLAMTWDGV